MSHQRRYVVGGKKKKTFEELVNNIVIRDFYIKTMIKYYYMPNKMAKIQKTDNTKCCPACAAAGTLLRYWQKCKKVKPLWKLDWQILTKLNIVLSYALVIVLLDICPTDSQPYGHTKTCMWIFIAAVFIIAPKWKLPRCSSIHSNKNKYIKK